MTGFDSFLDHLTAEGWSYGITTYTDTEGQRWTQVDATLRDEKKVWRWPLFSRDDSWNQ